MDVTWHKLAGPLFGNTLATLELDGPRASVTFAQPRSAGSLVEVARLTLTDGRGVGAGTPGRHAGAQT